MKLVLICSMRALQLAVQSRRSGFDIGMAYAYVFQVPMELDLKFMTVIGVNSIDQEGNLAMT